MTDEIKKCSKCGEQPAGPGGILCPDCVKKIENFDHYGRGNR